MYLTYDEFKEMGGTLENAKFRDLEREARLLVDEITFNRFRQDTEYPTELKECMYMLIRKQQTLDELTTESTTPDAEAQITSQSNDGVSISYNVLSASDVYENTRAEMLSTIRAYLYGVRNQQGQRVTYRGIYPNE